MQSLINIESSLQSHLNWNRFNSSFVIEVKRGNEIFTSTAVALNPYVAITAAHCVDCADEVVVLLGENYARPDSVMSAQKWIIHPGYDPRYSLYENDIAVLFLDDKLPNHLSYELLYDDIKLDHYAMIERIGFGGRDHKNVKIWTNPSYQSISFNKKNFLFNDNLSVIGDSGGPIYLEDEGHLKLIGLHSTLEGDHTTYAVNLSEYKIWIESLISLEEAI